MDDFNKALNVEVNKLIKWEAETDVEESETEAQLKAAVEEEAAQEVTQLHLLQSLCLLLIINMISAHTDGLPLVARMVNFKSFKLI